MADLHPLACVHRDAHLGRDVKIGPFCVIEAGVSVGDECELASHVVVKTGATLGRGNRVADGAVLGGAPQHLNAGPEQGRLEIGDNNQIRENVTIHRGLQPHDITRVGSECLLMVNVHIGHDCQVGDHVIVVNNSMIAGHVTLEDRAYLSGAVGIHQFCRIGRNAMVGGAARVVKDVPPYFTLDGGTTLMVGINRIGLRRGGFTHQQIADIKAAYRLLYRSGFSWEKILETLQQEYTSGPVAHLHQFLIGSKRGVTPERRGNGATIRIPSTPHVAVETRAPAATRKAG